MTGKIAFYTLGCKVNQYETEALREIFINRGYETVDQGGIADIYVINSCSVTGISDRKTRQFIRRTKKINPKAVTVLTGCYAETGSETISEMDEVDIILGNAEKWQVFEEVDAFLNAENSNDVSESLIKSEKIIRTGNVNKVNEYDDYGLINGMDSKTRAYIKIEDGCDRFCSYCIIPHARGPVRSRPLSSILSEANLLIEKGYKELILAGINTALYGSDQKKSNISKNEKIKDSGLIDLVNRISQLPGDFRIRLSSLEPTVINANIVSSLLTADKLCAHLHLSLQSGSDRILSSMGRHYTAEEYLEIVDVLKSADPNYSITTDIIVGYPGETEEDFADSMEMVRKAGFSKVHVFKYSKRSGTPAAEMSNQIESKVKNQRSRQLIEVADLSASKFVKMNTGAKRQALILEYDSKSGLYHGITDNDIDVYVAKDTITDAGTDIQFDSSIINTFRMITL